jgi:uncharacterized RDD family membrane protein YckC
VQVSAWRLLGKLDEGRRAWRRSDLSVSPMPDGVQAIKVYDAGGFNQHAVLFVEADSGEPFLQFARFEAPAEPTVSLTDVLAERQRPTTPDAVRLFMPFLPLLVVFYVMIYRRETLVQPLPLPATTAPAFMLQRLVALLIDLAPFALAGAAVMGIDWRERSGELVQWMIGSDLREMPDTDTIVWWFSSTAAYSVYALGMELMSQRTLGKLLVGVRVLSETGEPASITQIIVRNLTRFVELQPPMWLAMVLVIMSRNRQRFGDIMCRTLVVRRQVPPTPEKPDGSDRDAS